MHQNVARRELGARHMGGETEMFGIDGDALSEARGNFSCFTR